MVGSSADLEDLRRGLVRIASLDGVLVHTTDGAVLLGDAKVVDPRPIVSALLDGDGLTPAALRAAVSSGAAKELTARRLATAQRDLLRIKKQPAALDWFASTPRLFSRFGTVDAAWLDAHQARIDELSEQLEPSSTTGFEAALALIAALRGADAADGIRRAERSSLGVGARRRRRARRRLTLLLEALSGKDNAARPVAEAVRGASRPGRRSRRRLAEIVVRHVVGETPHGELLFPAGPLAEGVREVGEAAIARIGSTRSPRYVERLRRVLVTYGLMHDVRGPLGPRRLAVAETSTALVIEALPGVGLTMHQVLRLLESSESAAALRQSATWVEAGLSPEEAVEAARRKLRKDMRALADDPEAMVAYARWMLRLAPHFQRIGVKLQSHVTVFRALGRSNKRRELGLLAHCLVHHHEGTNPASVQRDLANLDATLGLFASTPEVVRDLTHRIAASEKGLGVRTVPEFAAWLSDDELLDRYLTLRRMVDGEARLSNRLLIDASRAARTAREHAYLASLASPSPRQRARLAALVRDDEDNPKRTRAWMRRRLDHLAATAYRVELDRALRALLEASFGFCPDRLDDAWRDAVRFFLATTQNRELLVMLLRHAGASPGVPIDDRREVCRAWLEKARRHMDVEAWLSPRGRNVEIRRKTYRLAVERDPLQVLRMGVPFGTCLSIEGGENAAATVIDALDVNKQVVYLRAEDGAIVGRQLIAVSSEYELLGYHVYCSLDGDEQRAAIDAFRDMFVSIADATGLTASHHGRPRQLHAGFWYCDPPEPFAATDVPDAQAAFCQALGRPVVDGVHDAAAVWAAIREGNVAAAAAHMDAHPGAGGQEACAWIEANADEDLIRALCRSNPSFHASMIRYIGDRDPIRGVRLSAVSDSWSTCEAAADVMARAAPSFQFAEALVDSAAASRVHQFDDHGLAHGTFQRLIGALRDAAVADVLRIADRIAPVWQWVVTQSRGHCEDCRSLAVAELVALAKDAYVRSPDPDAIIRVLRKRRAGLARRVAIEIAAVFTLDGSRPHRILHTSEPAPLPSVVRALRRLDAEATLHERRRLGAAIARHAIALQDEAERVPVEQLGSLMLHLDVQRLHADEIDLDNWRPTAWELYYHRRAPALRDRLRRADDDSNGVRYWRALIGDVEIEERVDRTVAEFVRAQVDGGTPIPPRIFGQDDSLWIDPACARRALDVFEQLDADDGERGNATELLWRALPNDRWIELLSGRVDYEVALWKRTLQKRMHDGATELTPDVVTKLWSKPELRETVADALGTPYGLWNRFRHLENTLDPSVVDVDELFATVVRQLDPALRIQPSYDIPPARLARWVCAASARHWYDNYLWISDATSMSRYLDASMEFLREHGDEIRALDAGELIGAQKVWLFDVLDGLRTDAR